MLSYSRTQMQGSQFYAKEYLVLHLNQVANNLLSITPSHVKDKEIFELEKFLNVLYTQAHNEAWPVDLQDAVLDALSRASELSDNITRKQPYQIRDRNFFKTLKSFVPILKMIAIFLED